MIKNSEQLLRVGKSIAKQMGKDYGGAWGVRANYSPLESFGQIAIFRNSETVRFRVMVSRKWGEYTVRASYSPSPSDEEFDNRKEFTEQGRKLPEVMLKALNHLPIPPMEKKRTSKPKARIQTKATARRPSGPEVYRKRSTCGGACSLPSADALAARRPAEANSLIRHAFEQVRKTRKLKIAQVRTDAKSKILAVRSSNAQRKKNVLEMLRRSLATKLQEIDAEKTQALASIARDYSTAAERIQRLRAATREHRRKVAETKRAHAGSVVKVKAAARMREKKGEALDEVRNHVEANDPELLAYFESVKNKLKHKPGRMSRTEHFYQLVHDNPEAAIAASSRDADRTVKALMEQSSKSWETRAKRIEFTICQRVRKLWARGKPFALTSGERAALKRIGVDPEQIEIACYAPARRVVSGRGASARASAPF